MKRRDCNALVALLPLMAGPARSGAASDTLKVSVAYMPALAESPDKGLVIDMVKALQKVAGRPFDIVVQPFARSIGDVVASKADAHVPLLQVPGSSASTDKFDYASEVLYPVNFVLYTKQGSAVTPQTMKSARIETDMGHKGYFDFPTTGSSDLLLSLKKVLLGRADGVVFADTVIDPMIRSQGLTGLKRAMYKVFDVKFVLPKGGHGGATDKLLSAAIRKLKTSGEWARLTQQVGLGRPYDDWQP